MIAALILLMASLVFAYIRVEALGKTFLVIQVLIGMPGLHMPFGRGTRMDGPDGVTIPEF